MLDVALKSAALVGLAEMGDKTQWLVLAMVARYRRPGPVLAGLAAGTLASAVLSVCAGAWIAAHVPEAAVRWILGLGLIVFAGTIVLGKEQASEDATFMNTAGRGAFWGTALALFVADIGDKTEIVSAGLVARYPGQWVAVLIGSLIGTYLADGLAVAFGAGVIRWASGPWVRWGLAVAFVGLGAWVLFH